MAFIKVPAKDVVRACEILLGKPNMIERKRIKTLKSMATFVRHSEYPYIILTEEDFYILNDFL